MFFFSYLAQPVDERDADCRQDEDAMNYGLPHYASLGVVGPSRAQTSRFDEGA